MNFNLILSLISVFSDSASVRHASLQNTLSYFQTLFVESDERVVKILRGKIKPRPRDAKYNEIDTKIQNAITEYEVDYTISIV